MLVTTGYGYYVKDGLRIAKYQLPLGEHPSLPQGITAVEVRDKATWDAIALDKSAEQVAWEKKKEEGQKARDAVKEKLISLGFTAQEADIFALG